MVMSVKSVGTRYQVGKSDSQDSKEQVVCEIFYMTGHIKEKCYFIHGFPSCHKLFENPKPKLRFNSVTTKQSSVTIFINSEASSTPVVSSF